jgi:murein L,D-transpeptidase YcbB/YkuD
VFPGPRALSCAGDRALTWGQAHGILAPISGVVTLPGSEELSGIMRLRKTSAASIALALVWGVGMTSCDTSSPTPNGARPGPTKAASEAAPEPVGTDKLVARTQSFLEAWKERETAFINGYEKGFKDTLAAPGWFKKLSTRVYEERRYSLIFSDGRALRANAESLRVAAGDVESHGLDPDPYELDDLGEMVVRIDRLRGEYDTSVKPPESEDEAKLWKTIESIRESLAIDPAAMALKFHEAGLDDGDVSLVDLAETRLDGVFSAKAKLNQALVDADISLLQRWFRYAYDMRFSRRAHPFAADKNDGDGVTRTQEALFEAYTNMDFEKIDEGLKTLVPGHPEYAKMIEGFKFYRELAASEAPQVKLERKVERVKKGSKGEHVEALQTRLIQEGYLEGEVDGQFGSGLEVAIRLYQQTHQLKENGEMSRSTRASMNKEFSSRADQVRLGLRRHRESELHQGELRFGDFPVQARVNIPAFEAVFFRDGVEARRHRIVVGLNDVSMDERTGQKGYFNRTRLFSETINTVVLNPTWRVTPRIKDELDLKLMEEPDFYEKNNYEVKTLDDGSEQVMQLPGSNNALGLVKFLFPNRFSIYMHDTPKKGKFRTHIRTGSHGCMRVQDALELAKWVLTEVGQLTEKRFHEILDSRETYGIALKTKIPLTIDYNVVGVHESGRMMFYSDVYRYDRDLASGVTPYPPLKESWLEQAVLVQ